MRPRDFCCKANPEPVPAPTPMPNPSAQAITSALDDENAKALAEMMAVMERKPGEARVKCDDHEMTSQRTYMLQLCLFL